jgi:hypothetical protein
MMTINVNPENDAPTTSDNTVTTDEDTNYVFELADFPFTDIDGGDAIEFVKIVTLPTDGKLYLDGVEITATDTEISVADITTGKLVFTPDADENGTGYATFDFAVSDGEEYSGDAMMTINVNPENDAPTTSDNTVTTDEDTNYVFELADFPFTDVDAGDVIEFVKIVSLPTDGKLYLDGVEITATDTEVSAADITAGKLVFTPDADENGTGYATFDFLVSDGEEYSVGETMTVNVDAVNDTPSFTAGANQSIEEGAGEQTVTSWATDLEQGGGADEDTQILSFEVSNDDNSLFDVQPSIDENGNLTYTPKDGVFGTVTVIVVIKDDGGTDNGGDDTSDEITFTISINATPEINLPTTQTINEDNVLTLSTANSNVISISDGDGNDQTVTLTTTNATLTLSTVTGLTFITGDGTSDVTMQFSGTLADINVALDGLKFTPSGDYNGSSSIVVTSLDINNGTSNTTLPITVLPVNDEPSFDEGTDIVIAEDSPAQSIEDWATDLEEGASNESSQDLDFNVTNDNNSLFTVQPSIDVDGKLMFTPVANVSGVATVTVILTDDGGTANGGDDTFATQTFTITVNPVNDPPLVDSNAITAIEEGESVPLDLDAPTDVDNTNLTITITGLPTIGTVTLANGTLVEEGDILTIEELIGLKYSPPVDYDGTSEIGDFEYSVTDGVLTSIGTVDITVTPINDVPTNDDVAFEGEEDKPVVMSNEKFEEQFDDPKEGDELESIQIVSLPDNGTLLLNGEPVTEGQVIPVENLDNLTFVPDDNFIGETSFEWLGFDGTDYALEPAETIITIAPINDIPVVSDFDKTTEEDTPLAFTEEDFTSNFSDTDGKELVEIKIVSLPENGILYLNGEPVTEGQIIPTDELGNLTFVPSENFHGEVTFEWNGSDGTNYASSPAVTTITVESVNDLPEIGDVYKNGAEDTPVAFAQEDFTSEFEDMMEMNWQRFKLFFFQIMVFFC